MERSGAVFRSSRVVGGEGAVVYILSRAVEVVAYGFLDWCYIEGAAGGRRTALADRGMSARRGKRGWVRVVCD